MRRALLAILALSFVVLAGCSGGGQTGPLYDGLFTNGRDGMLMSFASGMPPQEVFDEGKMTFSVGVEIRNAGQSAVGFEAPNNNYAYVDIEGIKPEEFGTTYEKLRLYFDQGRYRGQAVEGGVTLNGARPNREGDLIPGESTLIEFSDLTFLPDVYGDTTRTVRANLCYEYTTFATADICFKDNALENYQDATICELSGARPVSNSGSPVHVTSIVQNPTGSNRISVTFTVENVGTGAVFAPWWYQQDPTTPQPFEDDACIMNVGANQFRDVVYADLRLSSSDDATDLIKCNQFQGRPGGLVRMFGGEPATITCNILTDEEGSRIFTETLQITLHYNYFQSVETVLPIHDTQLGFVEPQITR